MRKLAKFVVIMLASAMLVGVVYGAATASDAANNKFKTKTYKWTAEAISVPFTATNAAAAAGVKIGQWPAGVIVVHGAVLKNHVVTVTATNGVTADSQGDVAVGSTVGTGTDITSTEINIIPKTTQNTMTNATSAYLADDAMIDGTSTAAGVYINLLMDMVGPTGAIHTNAVTSAGTLQIIYSELLDY